MLRWSLWTSSWTGVAAATWTRGACASGPPCTSPWSHASCVPLPCACSVSSQACLCACVLVRACACMYLCVCVRTVCVCPAYERRSFTVRQTSPWSCTAAVTSASGAAVRFWTSLPRTYLRPGPRSRSGFAPGVSLSMYVRVLNCPMWMHCLCVRILLYRAV